MCDYIYFIKFHGKQPNRASLTIVTLLVYSFKFKRPADRRDVIVRVGPSFDPLARAVLQLAADAQRSSNSVYGYCFLVLKTRLRNCNEYKKYIYEYIYRVLKQKHRSSTYRLLRYGLLKALDNRTCVAVCALRYICDKKIHLVQYIHFISCGKMSGKGNVTQTYTHCRGTANVTQTYTHCRGTVSVTQTYTHCRGTANVTQTYTHCRGTVSVTQTYTHYTNIE